MADQSHSTGATAPANDPFRQLAEDHGATFHQTASGRIAVRDRDGAYVIRGALSYCEASRSFCEETGILPPEGVTAVNLGDPEGLHNAIAKALGEPSAPLSPDAIKAAIREQYAEHASLPEWGSGWTAFLLDGATASRLNPHQTDSEASKAWSQGQSAARLFCKAMAVRADNPGRVTADWLAGFLRAGGRP